MPEVSVIIPVYNAASFVRPCLDALCLQTLADVEFILVDDGSTDDTAAVLDAYGKKDGRFKIIHQQNAGAGTARNRGLDVAKGKYVMFCDADDAFVPETCLYMKEAIENEAVDFVMCATQTVDESADDAAPSEFHLPDSFWFQQEGRFDMTRALRLETNVVVWNKIFRRDLLSAWGLRFPDGIGHEDAGFCWAYMFASDTAFFMGHKLYRHVTRQGSLMHRFYSEIEDDKAKLDIIASMIFVYDFLNKNVFLSARYDDFFVLLEQRVWWCVNTLKAQGRFQAVLRALIDAANFLRDKSLPDGENLPLLARLKSVSGTDFSPVVDFVLQ